MTDEGLDPWIHEHAARYLFALDSPLGESVLDIACGTGLGTYLIAETGRSVIGMDQDKQTIQNNKSKYVDTPNLSFVVGNAENLPLDSHLFNSVVSFETIEHLKNPKDFLREVHRVLRQDGIFLLSTPNAIITKPVDGKPSNPYHIREYQPDEIRDLLSEYFSVLDIYGQIVSPNYPVNYYWSQQKWRFLKGKFYLWTFCHRLFKYQPYLSNNLATRFFGVNLYPSPTDWKFEIDQVSSSHDLFVICKKLG